MSAVIIEAENPEGDRIKQNLELSVELTGDAIYLNCRQLMVLPRQLFDEDVRHHLHRLYLQRNILKSLPPEIKSLWQLRELYLLGNNLEVLPEEIGELPHLETLGLSNNQLTRIPRSIGRLHNLQRLQLSRNKLTHLPSEVGNLQQLVCLEVSQNHLRALPPELGQCGSLLQLCVDSNQLVTLPRQLCHLSHLKEITACDNQLLSLPQGVGRMRTLQAIYVDSNCCLTVVPVSALHKTIGFCGSGQQPIPEHLRSLQRHIVLGSRQEDKVVVPLPPEISSVGCLGSSCVPSLLELTLRHVHELLTSSAIKIEDGEVPADLLSLLRTPTDHCLQCCTAVFVSAFPAVFKGQDELHNLLLLGLCCSSSCVRQSSLAVHLPLLYPRLEDMALALVVA